VEFALATVESASLQSVGVTRVRLESIEGEDVMTIGIMRRRNTFAFAVSTLPCQRRCDWLGVIDDNGHRSRARLQQEGTTVVFSGSSEFTDSNTTEQGADAKVAQYSHRFSGSSKGGSNVRQTASESNSE
jgi:hypothetical protein